MTRGFRVHLTEERDAKNGATVAGDIGAGDIAEGETGEGTIGVGVIGKGMSGEVATVVGVTQEDVEEGGMVDFRIGFF